MGLVEVDTDTDIAQHLDLRMALEIIIVVKREVVHHPI